MLTVSTFAIYFFWCDLVFPFLISVFLSMIFLYLWSNFLVLELRVVKRTSFDLCFQRSYSKELFDDAIHRMAKACIKTETEIQQFRALQDKVEKIVIEKRRAEFDYGEIPDEFKGELTFHVSATGKIAIAKHASQGKLTSVMVT